MTLSGCLHSHIYYRWLRGPRRAPHSPFRPFSDVVDRDHPFYEGVQLRGRLSPSLHKYAYSLSLSLSLRFNDDFPSGPGLAGARMTPFTILLELRMAEVQSSSQKCHQQQTNTQFFTGRMPFLSPNQQHQRTEWKLYMHSLYQ